MRLGAAFVPIRKKGKLPGECVSAIYEKEYGAVSYFGHFRSYENAKCWLTGLL